MNQKEGFTNISFTSEQGEELNFFRILLTRIRNFLCSIGFFPNGNSQTCDPCVVRFLWSLLNILNLFTPINFINIDVRLVVSGMLIFGFFHFLLLIFLKFKLCGYFFFLLSQVLFCLIFARNLEGYPH